MGTTGWEGTESTVLATIITGHSGDRGGSGLVCPATNPPPKKIC